jgi:hypothetical protein
LLCINNISLLDSITTQAVGINEYMVNIAKSEGASDTNQSGNQTFIPLSATSQGHLIAAFRASESTNDSYIIRVVGYTL